jgi:hypothetical protein
MDSDMKWFILLMASLVVLPLIGLGIDHWRQYDCRLELARTGWYTPAEINEVCK